MAEGIFTKRSMPVGEIGWCHQCGRLQLLRDAPWLALPRLGMPWEVDWPTEPMPCCVECREAEPWELSVFPMEEKMRACAEAGHFSWNPKSHRYCEREVRGEQKSAENVA